MAFDELAIGVDTLEFFFETGILAQPNNFCLLGNKLNKSNSVIARTY